jgi:maleate cis-trans isomerase
MTPKEKAEELVQRFSRVIPFQDTYYSEEELYKMHKKDAKQCALICVDEFIDALDFNCSPTAEGLTEFYTEVKQEINKI